MEHVDLPAKQVRISWCRHGQVYFGGCAYLL